MFVASDAFFPYVANILPFVAYVVYVALRENYALPRVLFLGEIYRKQRVHCTQILHTEASCVKKANGTERICNFLSNTANFQQSRFWVLKISILSLKFPKWGFLLHVLHAFVDEHFPTAKNWGRAKGWVNFARVLCHDASVYTNFRVRTEHK